jgi:hypothetical protein
VENKELFSLVKKKIQANFLEQKIKFLGVRRPYLKIDGSYLHWLFKKDTEVLIDDDK